MYCADKCAEEKHIDVDAVFVLQTETFLLHGRVVVYRTRKRPELGFFIFHDELKVRFAAPAFDQPDIDIEQVEAAPDCVINDVVNAFGSRIKRRYRRHNDGAVLGGCQHATEVSRMEGCFAHD